MGVELQGPVKGRSIYYCECWHSFILTKNQTDFGAGLLL